MNNRNILLLLFILHTPFNTFAQSQKSEFNLDQILVVGDRSNVKIKESTIPSGVLSKTELESLPIRNLADALEYLPGITFGNLDASGHIPIPIIRGFYGGGEAEYVLLLVDGIPVNDFNNGIADWNIIPVNHIEKIELIRGGGSSAYGDLAIGGVINVVTKRNILKNNYSVSVKNDLYNRRALNLNTDYQKNLNSIGLNISQENAESYREHSKYKKNTYSGSYRRLFNLTNALNINFKYDELNLENSGALTQDLLNEDHLQSHSMYENDYRAYNKFSGTIQYSLGSDNRITILSGFRTLDQDETRTLQLTSDIGDSQFEEQTSTVFWNQLQYHRALKNLRILIGIDSEYGFFTSNYFDIQNKQKLSGGSGTGNKLGLYLQTKRKIADKVDIIAVLRLDNINNDGKIDSSEQNMNLSYQYSPRIGVSYQYINSKVLEGYIFSNWSKAFKSPTLDQLFDSRQINFGYYNINYSNSSLLPQESDNIDIGLNQKIILKNNIYGELSIVLYSMYIENEIDFDISTFKYGNISESIHRGIEASFGLFLSDRVNLRHSSNFTEVKFGGGDYKNNTLKNIPELSYTNRITIKISEQLSLLFGQKYFGSVYINDENTESLPAYSIFDANLKFTRSNYGIDVSIFNIGDKLYNGSAYMLFDQMIQQNVKFFYPAQKRNFQLSLSFNL